MSDTIDLLNTIGQNAALRYASAEELARTLEQEDASDAFRIAAASGDSSPLSAELGIKPVHVPQSVQAPGHEEDQPEQDDDDDLPTPERGKPSPQR